MNGVTADYLTVRDWPLPVRRVLHGADVTQRRRSRCSDETVAQHLFGDSDPFGQTIVKNVPFRSSGVLVPKVRRQRARIRTTCPDTRSLPPESPRRDGPARNRRADHRERDRSEAIERGDAEEIDALLPRAPPILPGLAPTSRPEPERHRSRRGDSRRS